MLLDTRRMALVNTGLNNQMQLERLFLAWRELPLDLEPVNPDAGSGNV